MNTILQDRQGFLWFGTEYGLNKYDGYEFTVYKRTPDDPGALAGNDVRAIYEDQSGALWVGTEAGLDRFDRRTGTFAHHEHDPANRTSLTAGQVRAIYEDREGTLWVGTDGGLSRYDRAGDTFTRCLLNLSVRSIYQDPDGGLWAGTNAGLARLDRATGMPEFYQNRPDDPQSLSNNSVWVLFESSEGMLYVATSSGINRLDRDSGTFSYDGVGLSIWAVYEGRRGDGWLGTAVGLVRVDAATGRVERYWHDPDDPFSLSDDSVRAIYEDRSGVLWVGTSGGISKASGQSERFTLFQQRPSSPEEGGGQHPYSYSLSDRSVLAVYEDRQGVLWVGTAAGGLNRLDRGEDVKIYQHDPDDPTSLSSDTVQVIYEDHEGVLWVGTSHGLARFDRPTETFVPYRLGLYVLPPVQQIWEDLSGDMWVMDSAHGHLYRLNRDLDFFSEQTIPELSGVGPFWALADRDGALWLGTLDGGIQLWDPVKEEFRQHYRHDPDDPRSLSNDTVIASYQDPAGVIWLGTAGGGLNRFDCASQTFTHYSEKDGLPGDRVTCILADAAGSLWLGTNRGLSRFDPNAGTFHNYDARDGLQGGEFWTCFVSDRGEMFFGGSEGLNAFYPHEIEDNPYIPPVVITKLVRFNETVRTDLPPGEHIELTYAENYLSFEFAALDYTDPARNQYAYMMEGLDRDWVYAGTRRHVDYPNLNPGRYVFRVRGSNNDGVWNEEGVALYITISPPFWQTWWFWLLVGLVLVGGVYGGYRLRVRDLQARSRALGQEVVERTREIERRKQELESLYRADEELYRHLRMERVLQALVDTAVEILGADKGALMVWDEQRERLVVRTAHGFSPETLAGMSFAPGQGVAGRVAATGEAAIVEDARGDARVTREITDPEGIGAFMQVPIAIGGEIFGVFSADYVQPRRFGEEERRLLAALAQRAAMAIENAQLYEQAQQLAAVRERNRLARDLHDSATQSLYAATLYADTATRLLSAGQEDLAGENLDKLRRAVKQALGEMRLLIFELRPPILEQQGLAAALEARLEAVEQRAGLKTQLTVEGKDRLPLEVEEGLYGIAMEALNNALKHARAGRIRVALRLNARPVVLEIADDGIGFDPAAADQSGGLGLPGMAERAAQLGGHLIVESKPGEGTVVQVQVEVGP